VVRLMTMPVSPFGTVVVHHRLLAIVEEMGYVMLRTSYAQILNSSSSFSTAICDLDGRLIAQAEHVPIHVGALPFAAKAMTEFFGEDIHPGRRLPAQRPLSRRQSSPRFDRLRAGFRGRPAAFLVDQPGASEQHRRRDAR